MTATYFVHTLLRARDWQHRPQLDKVRDWWRAGGRGVYAIVERILIEFLDGNDTGFRIPVNVFVHSFYDDDKPENFFLHLQIWPEGASSPEQQKSPRHLLLDIGQTLQPRVL